MAFIVLVLIIFIMLVVLIIQLFRRKPVKKLLLSYVAIFVGYHLYVSYTCGPNRSDVKVMKPMADAITKYLLKNGIPKSLDEIPNLPYKLEGCKGNDSKDKSCIFYTNNRRYNIKLVKYLEISYDLRVFAPNSYTGILVDFKIVNGGNFELEKSTNKSPNPLIYSSKINRHL